MVERNGIVSKSGTIIFTNRRQKKFREISCTISQKFREIQEQINFTIFFSSKLSFIKTIIFFLLQLDRDDDGTYQASGSANIILYVGLGMICIGLVITFVGLGDKGFRTLELKLIGPSLVGCGLFFALLRVLFCTVPSCCRAMCPCCKCCRKDEETEELIYATVSAISVLSCD